MRLDFFDTAARQIVMSFVRHSHRLPVEEKKPQQIYNSVVAVGL